MSIELKPCPFCGHEAEFERLGDRRQSCIVACTGCGARHESSDEGEHNGKSWDRREETAEVRRLRVQRDAFLDDWMAIESALAPVLAATSGPTPSDANRFINRILELRNAATRRQIEFTRDELSRNKG
jgi:Lar family restriction alleviation protein